MQMHKNTVEWDNNIIDQAFPKIGRGMNERRTIVDSEAHVPVKDDGVPGAGDSIFDVVGVEDNDWAVSLLLLDVGVICLGLVHSELSLGVDERTCTHRFSGANTVFTAEDNGVFDPFVEAVCDEDLDRPIDGPWVPLLLVPEEATERLIAAIAAALFADACVERSARRSDRSLVSVVASGLQLCSVG